MSDTKLTIELSEQALMDLLDGLEQGIAGLNPTYYRTSAIENMYDRIWDAKKLDKKKIDFLYEVEE